MPLIVYSFLKKKQHVIFQSSQPLARRWVHSGGNVRMGPRGATGFPSLPVLSQRTLSAEHNVPGRLPHLIVREK